MTETPGCRYAVIGACKEGRCLLARLWDVVDRCAQEKIKDAAEPGW